MGLRSYLQRRKLKMYITIRVNRSSVTTIFITGHEKLEGHLKLRGNSLQVTISSKIAHISAFEIHKSLSTSSFQFQN